MTAKTLDKIMCCVIIQVNTFVKEQEAPYMEEREHEKFCETFVGGYKTLQCNKD